MMLLNIFESIKYITTPLALIAFLAIIILMIIRSNNKKKIDVIKNIDEKDKARVVDAFLENLHVDTSDLSKQQRFELALKILNDKSRKFQLSIISGIIIFVIFCGLMIYLNYSNEKPAKKNDDSITAKIGKINFVPQNRYSFCDALRLLTSHVSSNFSDLKGDLIEADTLIGDSTFASKFLFDEGFESDITFSSDLDFPPSFDVYIFATSDSLVGLQKFEDVDKRLLTCLPHFVRSNNNALSKTYLKTVKYLSNNESIFLRLIKIKQHFNVSFSIEKRLD